MKPKLMLLSKLFYLGLLISLLSACVDQPRTSQIEQQLQEMRERPSGRIDPVPDFPEAIIPEYNQANQRDPFTPDRALGSQQVLPLDTGLAPDPGRTRTSLERWSLSELSLRGTMQKGQQVRALILTPERELVTVSVGDYLGQDHGKITDIRPQSIKLVELIHDSHGSWQEREQEINLSR